jgi:hypothetical protein
MSDPNPTTDRDEQQPANEAQRAVQRSLDWQDGGGDAR